MTLTLDAPPLAGETPTDGDIGGDVLFELRSITGRCTGGSSTGLEKEQECTAVKVHQCQE